MKNLVNNVNHLMALSVRVYRNLHKKCYSVQAKNKKGNWVVVGHVTQLQLRDVEFRVSKAGRERVLKERAKNVHSFVYGVVTSVLRADNTGCSVPVTYNPYHADHFFVIYTGQPVRYANAISLDCSGGTFYQHAWGERLEREKDEGW